MSSSASQPLISRLRASTRLVAIVLLLFVMQIGMVAACTVHDSESPDHSSSVTTTDGVIVADVDDNGSDPSGPGQHRGCSDCNCHHAAALLPQALTIDNPPARSRPPQVFFQVYHALPRRELRPPIV